MVKEKHKAWYAALKARDARFDGRFFVGVSSTGIYCRPICRARLPKPENCTFYLAAAEAEQAGYRPCLLCRPELAPGTAVVDALPSLARRAAGLLEENCGSGLHIDALAAQLGCTARHLRRVFMQAYNVSPVQYMQTCRLLLAKSLLTDTHLSILEVAMAAGFGSLRQFNTVFKAQYKLAPTALRRQAAPGDGQKDGIVLALGYRPPYQWDRLLAFLAQRAIPGVETVCEGAYLRTVHTMAKDKHIHGWIRVWNRPDKNRLMVMVSPSLLPQLPWVMARVRHLFDVACSPDAVAEILAPMNDMLPGAFVPGTRLPGCFDAFELAVRAVLGQQITVKAARTLAGRLVQTHGTPIQTGIEGLTHAFPAAEDVLALPGDICGHLGPLGIIRTRARTIQAIAAAMVAGHIDLDVSAQPETAITKLMALQGIGKWTASYIAMRALAWPDAFLQTDAGIKKALSPRTQAEMLAIAEAWRPWRSYATMNLWHSL